MKYYHLSGTVSPALGGMGAFIATQIHRDNEVDVFFAGLNVLVAERRNLD